MRSDRAGQESLYTCPVRVLSFPSPISEKNYKEKLMTKNELTAQMCEAVKKVREHNPMAPSITNSVTINFVANAQLAAGGSAAMVYLPDEGEFLAEVSKAFYVNAGTLLPVYEQSLPRTCKALFEKGCPWVLDPVGIGIGSLRTQLLRTMKEYKPAVIRGNASEIIAVAKLWNLLSDKDDSAKSKGARGVDSTDEVLAAKEAAQVIARYTGGAVSVSGETDLVTDGTVSVLCRGGSRFLPMITGAGCSLGGVTAVYCTEASPFIASLTATSVYNIAAKDAEKHCTGPGTFQASFLDSIYLLTTNAERMKDADIEILS